jgi:glutamyl-tRNA synthetase
MVKPVVTRFAPSPTGDLHLGSARTALFNWLYARHFGGSFQLRIEDTDQERSSQAFTDNILKDLAWMGLTWDTLMVQSTRQDRHRQVAQQLLDQGQAYRCFCTPEELAQMRQEARDQGRPPLYDRRWRDHHGPYPDQPFAVRLKMPAVGQTRLVDMVQGEVVVDHTVLDDMVILRSDGTPTYMLAVVVDDHDMGVTHIIRGDDHLTNAFRQIQVYRAMGWDVPVMGHIPLIHSAGGAKLSKRNGDLGLEAYRSMGILPEALCNTLVRLGWAHGNDEKISWAQAIAWFDGGGLSKSPARFDADKMLALNAHYLRLMTSEQLEVALHAWQASPTTSANSSGVLDNLEQKETLAAQEQRGLEQKEQEQRGLEQGEIEQKDKESKTAKTDGQAPVLAGQSSQMASGVADLVAPKLPKPLPPAARAILLALAQRSRTLDDLCQGVQSYLSAQLPDRVHLKGEARDLVQAFLTAIEAYDQPWGQEELEAWMRTWAQDKGCSFGALAKALRLALTGAPVSPSLTDVMAALGPHWTQLRLRDACPEDGPADPQPSCDF